MWSFPLSIQLSPVSTPALLCDGRAGFRLLRRTHLNAVSKPGAEWQGGELFYLTSDR